MKAVNERETSGPAFNGPNSATRKKVTAKKLGMIRAWKRNLTALLRTGAGLDMHLDTAMRELVDELKEWEDNINDNN